jgi:phosphomannomutase
MVNIKFGTDGWRAILHEEYTKENVARVAHATAIWLNENYSDPTVVVGHDTREGGAEFAEVTTRVLCEQGVRVLLAEGFVSTPMVCMGIVQAKADLGIVITASHNPPAYNGFKLKASFGGPLPPDQVSEIEGMILPEAEIPATDLSVYRDNGKLKAIDLEDMYIKAVEEKFDLDAIHDSGISIGYDAMYGAGQNVMKRLFPDATLLHCEHDTSFQGQAPEPIHKNLGEFSQLLKDNKIQFGLATDGDADRLGIYDEHGNFLNANHVILLLVHYLNKYKEIGGKVVVAFSTSVKIKKMCEAYGLPIEITRIGFKYIASSMATEDVLVGAEESGGVGVTGHLPERDGIWAGLILLEFMAKSGKTLTELIDEVYEVTGPFHFDRNDLHLDEEKKLAIIENCKAGHYSAFGDFTIESLEDTDGFKYHLGNDRAVMIRPSGTEPVLRVYAEGPDAAAVNEILEATTSTLME